MDPIQLHTAGATVQHRGPFSSLEVPTSTELLSAEIRDKWVRPLYFGLRQQGASQYLLEHLQEVDIDLVKALLANFDWRSRKTGAHLAALLGLSELEDQIGRLLLRSDVCYAGFGYCIAIAVFNTRLGVDFLNQYLTYYLTRKELFFDQNVVMATLKYLDDVNGTDHMSQHMPAWTEFVSGKQGWNLDSSIEGFKNYMDLLLELKRQIKR